MEQESTQVHEEEEAEEYQLWRLKSPEIVEIFEDNKSAVVGSRNNIGVTNDVYVAVGKNDLHVVRWTLNHAVFPGTKLFLLHVFSPITYIATPVGRLSRSQLSQDQARVYVNEERNRRKNLLEKYIRLCNDAKVSVDTMLLESDTTAKTILELIPIANITNLVMGTKRPPVLRQMRKGQGKGEYVRKNAPDFCKVTVVYKGQEILNGRQQQTEDFGSREKPQTTQNSERNFFECICFSGKSN